MIAALAGLGRPNAWALGVFGAGVLAMAAAVLVPMTPTRPDPALQPVIAMPTPLATPPADGYLAASPFDAARRPVDMGARLALPVDAPMSVTAVPEAPVRLAGILVEDERRRVLFAGTAVWQGIGSTIGSWSVAAVEPDVVILRRDEETLTLQRLEALQP